MSIRVLPYVSQPTNQKDPGEWNSSEAGVGPYLSNLADEMVVAQANAEIYSIPDVWAQCKLFDLALTDPGHDDHTQARRQWRGLLAMLGLFHLQPTNGLKVQTIELNWADITPDMRMGAYGDAEKFFMVLDRERPVRVMLDGADNGLSWDRIAVMSLELAKGSVPFALVVPDTIVCPAKSYRQALGGLSNLWARGGELVDPSDIANNGGGDPEELNVLEIYVDELWTRLTEVRLRLGNQDGNANTSASILRELGEFRQDLRLAFAGHDPGLQPGAKKEIPHVQIPHHEIYHAVFSPPAFARTRTARSSTVIEARPGFRFEDEFADLKGLAGFVLVDPAIETSLQQPATKIRVWGADTLANIPSARSKIRTELVKDMAEKGYIPLTPDDIFAPRVIRIREKSGAGGDPDRSGSQDRYLLPIRALMLCCFDPDRLAQIADVSVVNDNVICTFKVSLKNTIDGAVRQHTLKRTYRSSSDDSEIVDVEVFPQFTVWPDFRDDNWKDYYAYSSADPNRAATPDTPFGYQALLASSATLVSEVAMNGWENRPLDVFDTTLNSGGALSTRTVTLQKGTLKRQLHHSVDAIEAVNCKAPEKSGPAQGLALLSVGLGAPRSSGKSAVIGIDFGTSNTCVRISCDGQEQDLKFCDRIWSPPLSTVDPDHLAVAFIPHADIELPFLSVAREREGVSHTETSMVLGEQTIYYINDVASALDEISGGGKEAKPGSLRFNLKWSPDPADRVRLGRFIGQLALQSAAEAVHMGASLANIQWRIAFPEAFTANDRIQYTGKLRDGIAEIAGAKADIEEESESIASARHFYLRHKQDFVHNVVTFDIGGGTTDITLWNQGQLQWRSSVQLAGRDILREYIAEAPEFLRQLNSTKLATYAQRLEAFKEKAEINRLRHAVDVVINSKEFEKAFERGHKDVVAEYPALMHQAKVALAGLIYFVAMNARALGATLTGGPLAVCLGGRGSRLYKSLFDTSNSKELLKNLLSTQLGATATEFNFSGDYAKMEVAQGLVSRRDGFGDGAADPVKEKMVFAVDVTVGERRFAASDTFDPKALVDAFQDAKDAGNPLVEVTSLSHLLEFVREAKDGIMGSSELTKEQQEEMRSEIQSRLRTAIDGGVDRRANPFVYVEHSGVENPFILGLLWILRKIREDAVASAGTT